MEKAPFIYALSRFLLGIGLRTWNRYRAIGGEQIPVYGGVIVVSNHASFLDPPIVGCGMMRPIHFMARNSLFRNRLGGWWARNVGVISIDRNKGDIAAFKAAFAVLKSGGVLCLFPEGTRTLDGNLQAPKDGIGFLIIKAAVPVVPVYIEGSFNAFPKGAGWIKPAKITVRYGAPIMPDYFIKLDGGREIYRKAAELVMEKIAELGPQTGLKAG